MKTPWHRGRPAGLSREGPLPPSNDVTKFQVDPRDWRRAMSQVTFAFMLVLIMATVLFVSMGLNPKEEGYGKLPWIYAACCLVGSAACRSISRRLDPDPP